MMERISEEDTVVIIESRFVEFEKRLNKIIEIKIDKLERSIKKRLHSRLNTRVVCKMRARPQR